MQTGIFETLEQLTPAPPSMTMELLHARKDRWFAVVQTGGEEVLQKCKKLAGGNELLSLPQMTDQGSDTEKVTCWAESGDLAYGDRGDVTVGTKRFTGMDVGEVDLHRREADCRQGITDGDAGVGIGGGIDDDSGISIAGGLDRINQGTFTIGLKELDRYRQFGSQPRQFIIDTCQRGCPVNTGLPSTKQIQVWTMNDQNLHTDSLKKQW